MAAKPRKYSLSRRGKSGIWYVRFWNEAAQKYLTAKSTKEHDPREAVKVAERWLDEGIPQRDGTARDAAEVATLDTLLHQLRTLDLDLIAAKRIADALLDRNLLASYQLGGDGPDAEPLLQFLTRFWTYDESPYVAERHAFNVPFHKAR